jgi:molybdopterin/thiamine biosynthesis adenylyltransferase
MESLKDFLLAHAHEDVLPFEAELMASKRFNLPLREIEEEVLKLNIMPKRYMRNSKTISPSEQLTLLKSTVAVVGCGGLGGYAIEELARLGIGTIKAIDPDIFEEHNLNRQILCNISTLGKPKVEVARDRILDVNPAVRIDAIRGALTYENGEEFLRGSQVVVDGLDNIPSRIALSEICDVLNIPLVHGSIAGWYGQVTTQLPKTKSILKIYSHCHEENGVEKELGNPSFSPALVASLEVAEVCKIILDKGELLDKRVLFINMLDMEIGEIGL